MAKVFVLWYGKVLEGETDGTVGMFGMLEVRIHVQRMKATALFAPEHVYESEELAAGNHTEISVSAPKVAEKPREISRNEAKVSVSTENVSPEWLRLQRFKADNWDHQRNHLRIDKLDEFYEMWKASCAPVFKPLTVEGDIDKLAEEFANYDGVIYNPKAEVTTIIDA